MSRFQYTLHQDEEDIRDFNLEQLKEKLKLKVEVPEKLPNSVSLKHLLPKVKNQGSAGKCQSCAFASAVEEDDKGYNPSPIFHYYNIRKTDNTLDDINAGGTLRGTCKVAVKYGIADEKFWADDNKLWNTEPSEEAYDNALLHKNFEYYRATTIREIKEALYMAQKTGKQQFVILGIKIYESFESDDCLATGVVPMPNVNLEKLEGGHAVVCFAYDSEYLYFLNSWGEDLGDKGVFKIKYDIFQELYMDSWVVNVVE